MTCEPCTYSQESAGGSLPTSSLDTRQLSLLSGSHTPAKSLESELKKDGSPVCMCGKGTLDCSIHPSTRESWIASMQASLAKTLASLENRPDLVRALEADCTEKSSVLLASFDPAISFLKMSQQSLVEDLNPSFPTWPRWGLMRNGAVFEHPMSELRITETGGFYWPTPNAAPLSNNLNLQCSGDGRTKPNKLGWAVSMWTTPLASDTGHRKKKFAQDGTPLSMQVGGQVNPKFSAWLMGFPIAWANSKATAMPKSRCKPQQPTVCLEVSE